MDTFQKNKGFEIKMLIHIFYFERVLVNVFQKVLQRRLPGNS